MFLMRKNLFTPTAERGSSLLAVIGFMAVAAIATLAIVGSTMNSIGMSSATRAAVQSQSAAEAGIDDALFRFAKDGCPTATWGVTEPVSAVSVAFSLSDTNDVWSEGCPTDNAKRVKIVSNGSAADTGLAGNTTGDTAAVEVIYAFQPASSDIPATDGSTALYSYEIGGFSGSSIIVSVDVELPTFLIKHGDVNCGETSIAGTGIINANLVIEDGGLKLGGSCQVMGDVYSAEEVELIGSSQVWGNIVAPSIDATGSAKIHKNIYTTGLMTLRESAWVLGSVSAGTLNMSLSAKVDQSAWSAGSTFMGPTASTISGTLTTKSFDSGSSGFSIGVKNIVGSVIGQLGKLPGTIVQPVASTAPVAPVAPEVPDWVDIAYDVDDWVGYDRVTLSGACDYAAVAKVAVESTNPTLVNALGCSNGVSLKGSLVMDLPNDLVIFADNFQIGESAQLSAAAGSDRKLLLITPDNTPDNKPTCAPSATPASGQSNITESFIVNSSVSALIYTPCQLAMGFSAQWNGQFYGGTVSITASAQLRHSDVGTGQYSIFTPGTPGSVGLGSGLGARLSIRDLNG